jgi:hypothetical protein
MIGGFDQLAKLMTMLFWLLVALVGLETAFLIYLLVK